MVDHIRILLFSLSFISGISLVFYLNQVYKLHPYNFIRAIKQYNIVLTFILCIRIISIYVDKNLIKDVESIFISISVHTLDLVATITTFLLTYLLVNILLSFRDNRFTKRQNRWILFIGGILIVIYFMGFFIPEVYALLEWMDALRKEYGFINFILNLLETFILIGFYLIWSDHKLRKERVQLSKSFTISFIIYKVFTIMVPIYIIHFQVTIITAWIFIISVTFLLQLMFFVWTKYIFVKYAKKMLSLVNKNDLFASIYHEYKITKRESEIIELLINGKSTPEIKELLFISYHTVKNHISHIYEKLNVKTRHELIHFFIQRSI